MDAGNTYQVFDWLWSSGQLSKNDIDLLHKEGFISVINLALPSSSNALKGEAEMITNLGMNYFQIPIEWELPDVEHFYCFCSLLQSLHKLGHKVWIHCVVNNRVSAFLYLYRKLILKEPEEEASFPMREIWTPNQDWNDFINEVIQGYQENHQ